MWKKIEPFRGNNLMPQTTLESDIYRNQYPVLIKTIEILAHWESVVRNIVTACYVPVQNGNSES